MKKILNVAKMWLTKKMLRHYQIERCLVKKYFIIRLKTWVFILFAVHGQAFGLFGFGYQHKTRSSPAENSPPAQSLPEPSSLEYLNCPVLDENNLPRNFFTNTRSDHLPCVIELKIKRSDYISGFLQTGGDSYLMYNIKGTIVNAYPEIILQNKFYGKKLSLVMACSKFYIGPVGSRVLVFTKFYMDNRSPMLVKSSPFDQFLANVSFVMGVKEEFSRIVDQAPVFPIFRNNPIVKINVVALGIWRFRNLNDLFLEKLESNS